MSKPEIVALYGDGGVIARNPSHIGGMWAYCLVDGAGQRVVEKSGILTPADIRMHTVSNNVTEMAAIVYGLAALPDGWSGTVYSDSKITLDRLFHEAPWNGVPAAFVRLTAQHLPRLGKLTPTLLSGHPTKAELAAGVGRKGREVSEHNVFCDKECSRIGGEYHHEWTQAQKRKEAA